FSFAGRLSEEWTTARDRRSIFQGFNDGTGVAIFNVAPPPERSIANRGFGCGRSRRKLGGFMKRALTLITFWFVCAHVAYAAQARQSEFGVRADIVRGLAKIQARNHVRPTKHAAAQTHTFGISAPPLTAIGYLAGSIDNEGGN